MSEQYEIIKKAKMLIKSPPDWANWLLFIVLISLPPLIRFLKKAPIIALDNSYSFLIKEPRFLYDHLIQLTNYSWIIPWLLGLGSFTLFYLLVKDGKKIVKSYTLFFFTITPLITTIFSTYQPYSLFLFITLLGVYIYRKNYWFSGIIIALLPLILPFEGFLIALLFIIHGLMKKHESCSITLLLSTPLFIYIGLFFNWSLRVPDIDLGIKWFFGEFGGVFGFSLFIVLLAWYYILNNWKTIKKEEVILFILFFILSKWLPGLRPIIIMPMSVYAAKAFKEVFETKWSIEFLKGITVVLLICLGLFIVIEHQQTLINEYPTHNLDLLLGQTNYEGDIVTSDSYANYIKYKTGKEVFSEVLKENIVSKAINQLNKDGLKIIIITPEMKDGLVWQREDEGLLFVLNNERFIRAYQLQGYELWLYFDIGE